MRVFLNTYLSSILTHALLSIFPLRSKQELKEFVRLFQLSDVPAEEKVAALRRAASVVSKRVRAAASGNGCERHLYALKCMAQRDNLPVPAFFATEAWRALNHTKISTSNCGNPSLRLFGFGPVVSDGFGIGYIIKDSSISFCLASKHRQGGRLRSVLRSCVHSCFLFDYVCCCYYEYVLTNLQTRTYTGTYILGKTDTSWGSRVFSKNSRSSASCVPVPWVVKKKQSSKRRPPPAPQAQSQEAPRGAMMTMATAILVCH